jgi:hypothetical protein
MFDKPPLHRVSQKTPATQHEAGIPQRLNVVVLSLHAEVLGKQVQDRVHVSTAAQPKRTIQAMGWAPAKKQQQAVLANTVSD